MRTKIGVFCEKLLEGGWLLAVVVTPLFFNVYSSRVFEPDKISLLRSIALMMAAVWLVKESTSWFGGRKKRVVEGEGGLNKLRKPLVLPTLFVVVVYLVASLTSIVPRTSWLGSYQRLQGTYTTYSYIIIALIIMQELRRKEQFERLITTIILVSFPISLYGVIQHYGLDSMPWGSDVTARVTSNLGNAIFVGAFLILAIPLALARFVLGFQEMTHDAPRRFKWTMVLALAFTFVAEVVAWLSRGLGRGLGMGFLVIAAFFVLARYLRKPPAPFVLTACYQFVVSVQVMCLIFSQSRGPQIGMIAGIALFILLYFVIRRWSKAVWGWLGGGAALVAFLVVFNLPATPLQHLKSVPYLGRLGNLLETSGGTGKVRLLIWEGAVKLITSDPLRFVVGHGPESMYVAYNRFYPPELAHYESRNASPDRSHNETLDSFVTTGLLGFLAYIFIFASLFYYVLKWIGLLQDNRQRHSYILAIAVGTGAGLIIPFLIDRKGTLCGVGAMLGFVSGLFVYLIPNAIRVSRARLVQTNEKVWKSVWLAALASAVLAHLVEINFGIAIAATRTLFWVFVALVAVLGSAPWQAQAPEPAGSSSARSKAAQRPPPRPRKSASMRVKSERAVPAEDEAEPARVQLILLSLVLGYILSIMAWTFVTNPNQETDFLAILVNSFTTFAAKQQPEVHSSGMLWLVLSTLFIGCILIFTETVRLSPSHNISESLIRAGMVLGISSMIGLLYAISHAIRLITLTDVSSLISSFYSLTLIFWLVFGLISYLLLPRPQPSGSGWSLLVAAVVIPAVFVLVENVNIQPIKADIVYKQGLRYDESGDWDSAIQLYNRAVTIAPKEDYYWLFLGRVLMERARIETSKTAQEAYMQQTLQVLLTAQSLNPLNTDHTANLGRFYRTWAEMDTNDQSKKHKLEQAILYYQRANSLSPNHVQIIDEWGQAYFVAGDVDHAVLKYQEALAIDPEYANTYFYLGDAKLYTGEYQEAVAYYEKGLSLDDSVATAWSALTYAYSSLNEVDKAIDASLRVLALYPSDYNTLKNLALLYEKQGNLSLALQYGKQALAVAPEDQKSSLSDYVSTLEQRVAAGD